jgi:hypothetical protein
MVIAIGLSLVLLLGVVAYTTDQYAEGARNDREVLASALELGIPEIPSFPVTDSSLSQNAINRAEYLILQAQSANPEEGEIVQGLLDSAAGKVEISKSEENWWEALIYAREASIEAMTAIAYGQANEGKLSEKDVLDQVPRWANEIQILRTKLTYKGENLQDALITIVEVERSLDSAESWLKQTAEILSSSDMQREFRIGHAMGGLEAVRGNLEDAESLLDSVQKGGTDQEGAITDVYKKFYGETTLGVDGRAYPKESFANLTLDETKGFIERAESRFNNGYKASATTDIMYAFVSLRSLDTLSDIPDPWCSNATITAKDVYQDKEQAVKALNEAIENEGGDELALYLLQSARSDIEAADYLIKRCIDVGIFGSTESLRLAHALYVRASSYARNVNKVTELLGV